MERETIRLKFISRLPGTFGVEDELIQKTFNSDEREDMGHSPRRKMQQSTELKNPNKSFMAILTTF